MLSPSRQPWVKCYIVHGCSHKVWLGFFFIIIYQLKRSTTTHKGSAWLHFTVQPTSSHEWTFSKLPLCYGDTPFCVCVCARLCAIMCIYVNVCVQSDVPSPIWLEGGRTFLSLSSCIYISFSFVLFSCAFTTLVVLSSPAQDHFHLYTTCRRLPTINCLPPLSRQTVSHCSSLVRTQSMHCALSSLLRDHVNPRNLISEQKLFPLIYWSAFILSTNDFVNMKYTKTIKESVWIWDSWRMTNS